MGGRVPRPPSPPRPGYQARLWAVGHDVVRARRRMNSPSKFMFGNATERVPICNVHIGPRDDP